jgi:hypothetical protein
MIKEYTLLSAANANGLDLAVNSYIQMGYEPYCAPFAVYEAETNNTMLFQAMVKYGCRG